MRTRTPPAPYAAPPSAEVTPPLRDAHRFDRFSRGEGVSAPMTVAWGTRDRFIPRWARRGEGLPPHTRFVTLPRCGHVPSFDAAARLAGLIVGRHDLRRA